MEPISPDYSSFKDKEEEIHRLVFNIKAIVKQMDKLSLRLEPPENFKVQQNSGFEEKNGTFNF